MLFKQLKELEFTEEEMHTQIKEQFANKTCPEETFL